MPQRKESMCMCEEHSAMNYPQNLQTLVGLEDFTGIKSGQDTSTI